MSGESWGIFFTVVSVLALGIAAGARLLDFIDEVSREEDDGTDGGAL